MQTPSFFRGHFVNNLVAILALTAAAMAQDSKIADLSFSFKETGTKHEVRSNWETDYGSYDRDFIRKKNIQIEVRNLGRSDAKDVVVYVYWLALDNGSQSVCVYHINKVHVDVPAARSEQVNIESPQIIENQTQYEALGEHDSSGLKAKGYVVRVQYGGSNLQEQASAAVSSYADHKKLDPLIEDFDGDADEVTK